MNIGIEATSAFETQKAGVGYYTYNLLRAMAQLEESPHTYTLYLRRSFPEFAKIFPFSCGNPSKFTPKTLKFPYLWAQARLPFELWRHPQHAYFFPTSTIPLCYLPANSVVTVHDAAFLFFPDYFSPMLRHWLAISTKYVVRHAQKIITVSENTRQDILKHYDSDPENIVAIHHGIHPTFQPLAFDAVQHIKKKYQLNEPFLLCVGTLQRRKNIPRLLEAFYALKQEHQIPHKLVLIGQKYAVLPENEISKTLERLSLEQDVLCSGYIPEDDLPALINAADLFVLPSLYEGFGMPALEAMACGTPVACSNSSSLPEVVGESAVMFDPYNIESITTCIRQLLSDQQLRQQLRKRGLARATQFSWEKCARKTLHVLEQQL